MADPGKLTRYLLRFCPGDQTNLLLVDAEDVFDALGKGRQFEKKDPETFSNLVDVWSLETYQKASRWRHRRTYRANNLPEPVYEEEHADAYKSSRNHRTSS